MRGRALVAATAVLLATAACADPVWPSGADQAEFCDQVTRASFTGPGVPDEELRHLGTPRNLPHEARRYLLDLDEGEEPTAEGEAAFEEYVASYCR